MRITAPLSLFNAFFSTILLSFLSFTSINANEAPALTEELVAASSLPTATNPHVIFTTNLGEFTIELFVNDAPITTQNFLNYVENDFYNGTLFHRIIPGFMAQGGGFTSGMVQKNSQAPIKNESLSAPQNKRGTVAMARTSDPHSATNQFFINVNNNWSLDAKGSQYGYTVFAKVTNGMDIIDKIVNSPSGSSGPFQNVPKDEITIISASIIKADAK